VYAATDYPGLAIQAFSIGADLETPWSDGKKEIPMSTRCALERGRS